MTEILELLEFLFESNLIESEPSGQALFDAVKAWEYLSDKSELTVADILSTHSFLMKSLNPRIAGRVRKVGVYIGGHMGANPASVPFLLDDLVKKIPKTEEEIKQWHIDYEAIHPFEDGNGRTGRIFMNWQRIQNSLPLLIIHEGEEQFDYYNWFREEQEDER